MADLHETNNPEHKAEIDSEGWVFLAFAVAIIAIAGMVAYDGNNAMLENGPVSHVASR